MADICGEARLIILPPGLSVTEYYERVGTATAEPEPPSEIKHCPYSAHRPTDWFGAAGKVICGVCHPRAVPC
jgi:hypothetical protein